MIYLYLKIPSASRQGMQNAPTASLQKGKTSPTSVLNMKLNNLMVRLQKHRSFGQCRSLLYCRRSLVHSGLKWLHLIGSNLWVE